MQMNFNNLYPHPPNGLGDVGMSQSNTKETTLTCSVCSETFRRAEHLKRHTLTHIEDKPHICSFCNSRYKRTDALRRHWKTCPKRVASGTQIPKRSLSGKRKQACDRCTLRKRVCSTGQPCSECALQIAECTYHGAQGVLRRSPETETDDVRIESDTALASGGIVSEAGLSSSLPQSRRRQRQKIVRGNLGGEVGSSTQRERGDSSTSPQTQFDFLANFTRAAGLDEAYNYPPRMNPLSPVHAYFQDMESGSFPLEESTGTLSNPFDCYLDEVEASLWGSIEPSQYFAENHIRHDSPLMAEKACQLWGALQSQLENRVYDQFDPYSIEMATFFSPQNLTRFLDLFWSRWYRHCPIIHKATFDLENCSILLIATMSLIGACMSSQDSDHQTAKQVLDTVEELIFSNPTFSETAFIGWREESLSETRHNVEILQATCFMCLLQKWEGNDAAKLRMQRHRFTSFVATTRAMGLSQATHDRDSEHLCTNINDSHWREWILREEMIRTFNHIFLLDSAFVIFHNSVPRMVLQEMTIELTCPESVFQASTPDEFMVAINSNPSRPTPLLLTDCIRTLCAEDPDPAILASLHSQSALNLFTVATAIHGLIFHQLRAFSPLPLATDPLKRALDRWENAWESSMNKLAKSDNLSEDNQQCAFPHRAREFALLARVHIEKSHLSTEEWNAMVNNLSENASRISGERLATFDQTNMDQVAGLISAVEHLDLK